MIFVTDRDLNLLLEKLSVKNDVAFRDRKVWFVLRKRDFKNFKKVTKSDFSSWIVVFAFGRTGPYHRFCSLEA